MIDIVLLRMMRVKTDYSKLISALDLGALERKTKSVVHAIGRYYKQYPSHGKIEFSIFIPFVERSVYPDMSTEDKQVYRNIIKNMIRDYPDAATRTGMMQEIYQLNLVHKTRRITEQYNDGDDIDAVQELNDALELYNGAVGACSLPDVGDNIDALLDELEDDGGVQWRLKCLRDSMRGFRGGDFGVIAARPDQGKTSFIASEITFMAPQVPDDRCTVWFNNEGPGIRILPRLMQAALNCDTDALIKKKAAGTLHKEYYEAIGGEERIRVLDIHEWPAHKVEALIAEINPGLIVYDMIDNIRGFSTAGARTDERLEAMYQWARDKAVKYGAIALATSQISNDGANEQYPGLGDLKDSKTGKQGASDFQLMIGSIERDPTYTNTRWLSLPKNKLRKLKSGTLREQVIFDRDRARYRDIETETE